MDFSVQICKIQVSTITISTTIPINLNHKYLFGALQTISTEHLNYPTDHKKFVAMLPRSLNIVVVILYSFFNAHGSRSHPFSI
ncbi:hypothetical protein EYC80_000456 [Monilinia laxa]|uniref:Uncharacterized protein n=1 Tax=Monilinia laxa TaxID=61186 RepID=A0A5N6KAQ8_MONLA|nr:hypothetical protein EYC80_000456 [Monilinia laxa]